MAVEDTRLNAEQPNLVMTLQFVTDFGTNAAIFNLGVFAYSLEKPHSNY